MSLPGRPKILLTAASRRLAFYFPTAVAEGILLRQAHMGASAWRRLYPEGVRAPNGVTWYLSLLMSKKFPEFSRLFWRSVKSKPGLHPAMQARMWKPGQSGNPAGVSKAYAEAMREISVRSGELSLGAGAPADGARSVSKASQLCAWMLRPTSPQN